MPPLPIHAICPSCLRVNGTEIYHSKELDLLEITENLKTRLLLEFWRKVREEIQHPMSLISWKISNYLVCTNRLQMHPNQFIQQPSETLLKLTNAKYEFLISRLLKRFLKSSSLSPLIWRNIVVTLDKEETNQCWYHTSKRLQIEPANLPILYRIAKGKHL